MRVFRHKREDTVGAYNFDPFQIYVCTLSNTKGEIKKGITVISCQTAIEIPVLLTKEEGLVLASYLESIANGDIPKKYKSKSGWFNLFSSMYFSFTKLKNGMLKGRISVGSTSEFVTVKPSSVRACSGALNKLYSESHA